MGLLIITLLVFSCGDSDVTNNNSVNTEAGLETNIDLEAGLEPEEENSSEGFKGYLWSVENEGSTVFCLVPFIWLKKTCIPLIKV